MPLGYDDKTITVSYSVSCSPGEIEEIAEGIALEQTVEMPKAAIRDRRILEEIVGKVISISETDDDRRYLVRIAYPDVVTGFQIPQFFNFLFGNISFRPGIRVADIDFSEGFIGSFRGPKFGIEGIRELTGVFGRPFIATALKPMGTSAEELGNICYQFALGGIDVIKDDHGLVDFPFCAFRDRVTRCMNAVKRAEKRTGKRTLYFPNVTGRFEKIIEDIEFVLEAGAGGLLVAPFLVGLDCVRHISESGWIDKPLMSHPALSGIFFGHRESGIAPEIVLGKLFRLIGIDCSVYPNFGGRFTFDRETCAGIAGSLTGGFHHMKRSFPTPAGGMSLDNISEIAAFYGDDVILLVGGSLYSRSDDLEGNTRYFLERVMARDARLGD